MFASAFYMVGFGQYIVETAPFLDGRTLVVLVGLAGLVLILGLNYYGRGVQRRTEPHDRHGISDRPRLHRPGAVLHRGSQPGRLHTHGTERNRRHDGYRLRHLPWVRDHRHGRWRNQRPRTAHPADDGAVGRGRDAAVRGGDARLDGRHSLPRTGGIARGPWRTWRLSTWGRSAWWQSSLRR